MRLIHLTDLHLSSLDGESFWRLRGKRRLGYLSWQRRRRLIHRPEMLERLAAAVAREAADQIAISGDLIQIGLPEEVTQAARWLPRLGSPERVILVPGNHDLYAADSWNAVRQHWGPYLHLAGGDGASDAYPIYRQYGDVALIGLSSARPSPALLASGRLGAAQRQRLADLLRRCAAEKRFCCLMLHHPPLPGMVSQRKGLEDAAELGSLIRNHSVQLALHGHVHRNSERMSDQTAIYGTASASSVSAAAPAAYRVFDIAAAADGWRLKMTLKSIDPKAAPSSGFRILAERELRLPGP